MKILLIAVSLLLITFSKIASSKESYNRHADNLGIQINYQGDLTKELLLKKIGITENYFNTLIYKKLLSLAYLGKCGLSPNYAITLISFKVDQYEDSGTEEISHFDILLNYDQIELSYSLMRVDGNGFDYDPLLDFSYKCN